jgi:tetratricopeptide (TPR) repeat protein
MPGSTVFAAIGRSALAASWEVSMKNIRLLALLVLMLGGSTWAQRKIVIPAGTPEDQALVAIGNENDAQKKIALLEDFVTKFASNAAAAAYGNWQLSQQYSATGDNAKALTYGDKALAAMPDVIDIIVSQADMAQQLKANDKVVDYVTRGAAAFHAIPADAESADAMAAYKQQYEYLETVGYNAIANEQDAKKRMAEIDRYLSTFANGRFTQNLTTLAVITFQEMKDSAGLAAFGDKVLEKNPNDMRLLTVLANAYISDPSGAHVAKAGAFARKAIELQAKAGDADAKNLSGVAHSVLGQVLLRESKYSPAVAELKTATGLLKDSPQDAAGAYYFLGFAYVKMERAADAIAALNEAAKADTPYRAPAQELIGKIQAARRKK